MKSHIVIDARLYGTKHTGLGRYTKNLLIALSKLPDFNKYNFTLLVYPELIKEIKKDLGNKFSYHSTNLRHYSIGEQIFLPFILYILRPTLVHFTHLDKPILYLGKSIVTVHDLIKLFSKGQETSTKSPLIYWPKYFGYLLMTRIVLVTSSIIVPSNFWRNYIIKKYNYPPTKIITTYEAVDPNFKSLSLLPAGRHGQRTSAPEDYILYTGNLYPYKNIIVIFKALQNLPSLKLKIISARDIFTTRALAAAKHLRVDSQIEFLGYVPDQEFLQLYKQALALVHPAFLEGFSLTGLEAMALSCPVIASNSSCLPEIYQDSVLYFDPHSHLELVNQILKLQKSDQLRQQMIKKGHIQITKYSWHKTALNTMKFYDQQIS